MKYIVYGRLLKKNSYNYTIMKKGIIIKMLKEDIKIYKLYKEKGLTPEVKEYIINNLKWYEKNYNELMGD